YNLKPKVGHAGTLDPFATGLLIVGVGRDATKRLDEFKGMKKEYIATIRLGATSDTFDRTGTIQETNHKKQTISKSHISNVLNSFIGKQSQLPPMYSAKKVGGKKLYELARKGIEIERQPSEIEMYEIELLEMKTLPPSRGELEGGYAEAKTSVDRQPHPNPPLSKGRELSSLSTITLRVSCSTGTYIRTLAHDIGQVLGTGAYCEELRRTKIGEYSVENAIEVEDLTVDNIQNDIRSL
ncbi:MAG: tRNA pseudouridine(55) synthase TruB, partial [Candidatus Magasanikbacteria bacterium CG10_big_fil_rev_8_21_14_0_10_43_9]